MAQPALARARLVAVTLPGHAGTPPPVDFSIESYARLAAELAADLGCDVVTGLQHRRQRRARDGRVDALDPADQVSLSRPPPDATDDPPAPTRTTRAESLAP
jgi:hypothetical protein